MPACHGAQCQAIGLQINDHIDAFNFPRDLSMENLQRRVPFGSCKWGAKGVTETQVGDMLCMYIIYIYYYIAIIYICTFRYTYTYMIYVG